MFKLCLDNGLPAKPYKFVNHFDDFEKTEEYNFFDFDFKNSIKMVVINIQEINNIGQFEKINLLNNQLWIESDKQYIICDKLSKETIDFIKKNEFVVLGFFEINQEGDSIKTLKRKVEII